MIEKAQVHIVDPNADARNTLRLFLERNGFGVTGRASAASFLKRTNHVRGCVVLDLSPEGEAAESILATLVRGACPVVGIANRSDVGAAVTAVKLGVHDVLDRPVGEDALVDAVRTAKAVHRQRATRRAAEAEARQRVSTLTAREREVLRLMMAGLTNKQMAKLLALSQRTVEMHRARIGPKLGLVTSSEIIAFGLLVGLEPDHAYRSITSPSGSGPVVGHDGHVSFPPI